MSAVIKAMRSTKKISAAVSVSEMSSLVETDDAAKRALVRQGHSAAALQNDLRGQSAGMGRCCGLPPPVFLY